MLWNTTATNVNIVKVDDNVLVLNATTYINSGFLLKRNQGIQDGVVCPGGGVINEPLE
jgi:hypothetical protein